MPLALDWHHVDPILMVLNCQNKRKTCQNVQVCSGKCLSWPSNVKHGCGHRTCKNPPLRHEPSMRWSKTPQTAERLAEKLDGRRGPCDGLSFQQRRLLPRQTCRPGHPL